MDYLYIAGILHLAGVLVVALYFIALLYTFYLDSVSNLFKKSKIFRIYGDFNRAKVFLTFLYKMCKD